MSTQAILWDRKEEPPHPLYLDFLNNLPKARFDGETYDHERDQARLAGQLGRVFMLMRDGKWRTLDEICEVIGEKSQAAVSARLRDLRKKRFGSHTVNRQHLGSGLYEYQVIVNAAK